MDGALDLFGSCRWPHRTSPPQAGRTFIRYFVLRKRRNEVRGQSLDWGIFLDERDTVLRFLGHLQVTERPRSVGPTL
jgi:hypothetical protein